MTKSDNNDFLKLDDSAIKTKIDELRSELFELRFQRATRQLTQTHRFKEVRVKLAQLLTILGERDRSKTPS